MKTPLLFDVPKTHPSRKEKIKAFKELHGIETVNSQLPKGEQPWTACLMPKAHQIGAGYGCDPKSNFMDLFVKIGRLLCESKIMVNGETERDAIRTLCDENNIVCDL